MGKLRNSHCSKKSPRKVISKGIFALYQKGIPSHAPTDKTTSRITGIEIISGVGTPVISESLLKKPNCFSSTRCNKNNPNVVQYGSFIDSQEPRDGTANHRINPPKNPDVNISIVTKPNAQYPTPNIETVKRNEMHIIEGVFFII